MNYSIKSYFACGVSIVLTVFLGMLSGKISHFGPATMAWYDALLKPIYCPPSWIFGYVWTVLYICIGITFYELLKIYQQKPNVMIIYGLHFMSNLIWSPLFFYMHDITLALYDLILMWVLLVIFMYQTYQNIRDYFWLNVPYFLWVSFALMLNGHIYFLNRV